MRKLSLKKCVKWLLIVFVVLLGIGFAMDTEPPVMNGINQTVEYGTKLSFSEIVEVTDNRSEQIQIEIISTDLTGITVDNEKQTITCNDTGDYDVEISATDESENQSLETVSIEVIDTQNPKIVSYNDKISIGYNEIANVESRDEFLALQIEDKSEYTIAIVNVENTEAEETTKTEETTKEEIIESNEITKAEEITEETVDLYELNDTKNEIKFLELGTYSLEFSIEDSFGNVITENTIVEVVDKTAPVIECEENSFSLADTDKKGDYIAKLSANDEIDGDLTKVIEIDDSEVKYGTVGEYKIRATVADKNENTCTETFTVLIKDKTAPKIKLSKSTFSLTVDSSAPDYSSVVTAVDGVDGDITELVQIDDSKVDYNSAGTYKVTYKVTDSSGNTATKKATIKIKEVSSSSSNSYSSSGAQVMITRTGECYHTHKCGNGNYFWVSMSEALSRGLRACSKCY